MTKDFDAREMTKELCPIHERGCRDTLSYAYKGANISSNAGTGGQHERLLILHPNYPYKMTLEA